MHPMAWWSLSMKTTQMLVEAQLVITMRIWGLAGAWPMTPGESTRMWAEKGPAFVKASNAATLAVLHGKGPAKVAEAALKPIGSKTRSNVRRLTRK